MHSTQNHGELAITRIWDYIRPSVDGLLSLFVCQPCQTFSLPARCDAYETLILIVHQMRRTKYVHMPYTYKVV